MAWGKRVAYLVWPGEARERVALEHIHTRWCFMIDSVRRNRITLQQVEEYLRAKSVAIRYNQVPVRSLGRVRECSFCSRTLAPVIYWYPRNPTSNQVTNSILSDGEFFSRFRTW